MALRTPQPPGWETRPLPYPPPTVFGRSERARFEYRVIRLERTPDEARLNALGADGWLLVAALPAEEGGGRAETAGLAGVFVRPVA